MSIEQKQKCNNTSPTTNIKCLIFTLMLVFIYLLPKNNKWILLLLFYLPYGIMSWYDDYYFGHCGNQFGPTYLRMFYEFWKPYDSKQRIAYRKWCPEQANKVFWIDIFILILFLIFFFKFFLPI